MFKKLLIVLALMFVFSDGAFACCALCNVSGWELLKIFVLPLLIGVLTLIYSIQGVYILFVEKNKLALLRMVPFLMFISWIFFNTNN
jgi:hypothetical protein